MERKHLVYAIFSPNNKVYIGYTSQKLGERFRQHKLRVGKARHPLYDCMKKYGVDNFKIEIIAAFSDQESALALEKELIQLGWEFLEMFNLVEGGDDTIIHAGKIFRKMMLENADFRRAYGKRVSEGVLKSESHKANLVKMTEKAKRWNKEHPAAAWKNAYRASRIARSKLGISGVSKKEERKPMNKTQSRKRRQQAAAAVWAGLTEKQKQERKLKISASVKKFHSTKTESDKKAHEEQLREARKHIDHDKRKDNQRKAIKEYWRKKNESKNV